MPRPSAALLLAATLAGLIALGTPDRPARAQGGGATALPEPALGAMRSFQVWRDELPDRIDPAELEIVLLSPDSRCRPPPLKALFGLSASALHPVTGAFCRRIESFLKAPPEPLPVATRVVTPPAVARPPAGVLAALEPAATRRYVALVHWDWTVAGRETHWLFEAAVLERESGRWLWHGARAHTIVPLPGLQDETEQRALRALLQHELPRDLMDRGWWREAVPLPDSRWVPAEAIAGHRPAADRAALAIVNGYTSPNPHDDTRALKLWPAGTPEVDDTERLRQADRSRYSTVRRSQSTPLLAPWTHALLDLPAGDYAMRVGREPASLRLEPGRITVLRIDRAVGNATVHTIETEAWWRERILGDRGRHAFLPEPPSRGRPAVVPYFVDAAP